MEFELSDLGRQFAQPSGIEELMQDLGHAMRQEGRVHMLGGGNPALIPSVARVWRQEIQRLLEHDPDRLDRMLANYDPCRGNPDFLDAVAGFFNRHFDWGITESNIAVTNGGQTAFFFLLNMLGGPTQGKNRHIVLPLVPEYIGYANQGLSAELFRAVRPRIELIGDDLFKYRVDFDSLEINEQAGAICVSRPTNPTGNVLTDQEIANLQSLAADQQIPLIVDNAYGTPFPQIVFRDATPPWGDNVVLTYSLSKLGLPGTRTGIVIGPPAIIRAIGSMNAVAGLANGNIGQTLVTPMLNDDRLFRMCRDEIQPFYEARSKQAIDWLREYMPPGSYRVHVSEGALFLWLWLQDLPITARELYERLKQRGVLVIPGEHFFFGLETPWTHGQECIRLTFSMPESSVREGIQIIADEVQERRGG